MAITAALSTVESSVAQGSPARLLLLITNTGGTAVDLDSVTFEVQPKNPSVVLPQVVFPPGVTTQIAGSNGTQTIGVDVTVNGELLPAEQLNSAGFIAQVVTNDAGVRTNTASNVVQVASTAAGGGYVPTRAQGSLHLESNRQSAWIAVLIP